MQIPIHLVAIGAMLWLQVANSIAWLALPILAPQVALDVQVEPSWIGQTAGLMFAGALVPTILSGPLIPRFGPVRIMQLCGLVSGFGILIGEIGTWWSIVVCALVVGAGYGPAGPGSSVILAAHTKPTARGLVFSIKQSGVPIGGAIAGATLPVIALVFDWRVAITVCAVVLLGSAIAMEFVRRRLDAPILTEARPNLRDVIRAMSLLAGIKAHPDLPRVAFNGFSAAAMQGSVFALFVTFLVARGKLDLVSAGLAFSALHLAGTTSRPLMGLASDKIIAPQALLALLGALATVAVMTLMLTADRLPYGAIIALAVVIGATASGWNGVLLAELARLAPPGRVSQVTASSIVYVYLGYTVGPLLTAALVGWSGSYVTAFIPVSVSLAAAALRFALHATRRETGPA